MKSSTINLCNPRFTSHTCSYSLTPVTSQSFILVTYIKYRNLDPGDCFLQIRFSKNFNIFVDQKIRPNMCFKTRGRAYETLYF